MAAFSLAHGITILLASVFLALQFSGSSERPPTNSVDEKILDAALRKDLINVSDRKHDHDIVGQLLRMGTISLEDFCLLAEGECFEVQQRFTVENGRLKGYRSISIPGNEDFALTLSELAIPQTLTSDFLDPLHWRINHSVLVKEYNQIQVASGFMLGSLSLDAAAPQQRLLLIGVGGGAATNFLKTLPANLYIDAVELEPELIRVGRKYFELADSASVHVFVEDGVSYLQKAVEKGLTYDSVYLDACSNDMDTNDIVGPAEPFRNERVISQFQQAIGPDGTLVVNMFATRDVDEKQSEVTEFFSQYFASCFDLRYMKRRRMLFCSNKQNWSWNLYKPTFLDALEKFDSQAHTKLADAIRLYNN